ncbi:MAG: phosphate acyltransferase [Rickettsiales bacterium]|nr:phosphate acyltransferase [Rickettsiales bacterium]
MKKIILAIDIMGGDFGPKTTIEGVAIASEAYPNVKFVLFGDKNKSKDELKKISNLNNYEFIHTSESIRSTDQPVNALRKLKKSSMRLGINSIKLNECDGLVSAGNTGALMAISKFVLKTIKAIDRPAIAALMPTMKGQTVILDLGANVECSSENLVQFAIMGDMFSRSVLGIRHPKLGLLNVGSEQIKGNTVVKRTFDDLKKMNSKINFFGYVEGNDINKGIVDVIVTDGFSGNIALKTAEGVAELIFTFLKNAYASSLISKVGYLLSKPAINRFKTRIDPRKYNGAVLLGLNGIVVKSHGGTDAFGFSNAIGVAVSLIENSYIDEIKKKIES